MIKRASPDNTPEHAGLSEDSPIPDNYDFAQFKGKTDYISRRHFLQYFLPGGEGSPHQPRYRLSGLVNFSDQALEAIVPSIRVGCQIVEREGFVWGRSDPQGAYGRLFPVDTPAYSAFALFDCGNTLSSIAVQVGGKLGWESGQAFAYVRGLFLYLVEREICAPG